MPEQTGAEFLGAFTQVPAAAAAVRLVAAACLAALIGFEREVLGKPAGLRTHILVAVAAALFFLISTELARTTAVPEDVKRVDPLRLIEAITAGVAFLAAGIIVSAGGEVRNITTGASLWLSGAIGLACGAGLLLLAGLATAIVLCVLYVLRKVERWLGTRD